MALLGPRVAPSGVSHWVRPLTPGCAERRPAAPLGSTRGYLLQEGSPGWSRAARPGGTRGRAQPRGTAPEPGVPGCDIGRLRECKQGRDPERLAAPADRAGWSRYDDEGSLCCAPGNGRTHAWQYLWRVVPGDHGRRQPRSRLPGHHRRLSAWPAALRRGPVARPAASPAGTVAPRYPAQGGGPAGNLVRGLRGGHGRHLHWPGVPQHRPAQPGLRGHQGEIPSGPCRFHL